MREKNHANWSIIVFLGFWAFLALIIMLSCDNPTGNDTVTVQNKLLIYTDVSSMPVNGGTANILVKVYSGNDTTKAVSNVHVQFSSSLGSVKAQNTLTDARGYARAIAYAGKRSGGMGITASIENFSNTIFITVTPGPSLVFANPAEILADGRSQSMITAAVIDSLGQPVPSIAVQFTASSGTITPQSYTDSQGKAVAMLRSSASAGDVTATVSARSDAAKITVPGKTGEKTAKAVAVQSSIGSATVVFKGITITCVSENSSVYANGADSTTIAISVKESTSGAAVAGANLALSTNLGVLRTKETVTDAAGKALVVLFGSNVSGLAIVNAAISDQLYASTEIRLAKQLSMTLMSNPSSVYANGSETAAIIAQINDSYGNPLQGEEVFFTTSLGTIAPSAITDQWGYAKVNIRSSRATGVAAVKATCQNIEENINIEFTATPGIPPVIANPSDILADGRSRSMITATVIDSLGYPTPGVPVQFVSTAGTVTAQSYTDITGKAEAALTSIVSEKDMLAIISASAGTGKNAMAMKGVKFAAKSADATGSIGTTTVVFKGITVFCAAEKNTVYANDADSAMVNITVRETTSGAAVAGANLALSTNLGLLRANTAVTDASGKASVILFGANVSGIARVQATISGQVSASADILLSKQLFMTLTSNPSNVTANGGDTSEIIVLIKDSFGNPLQDEQVFFTTSLGAIAPTAQTDQWGVAKTNLRSSSSTGVAIVKVKCQTVEKNINVEFIGAEIKPQSIQLALTPSVAGVKRTGQNETLEIKADVRDNNNNPIADTVWIQFELIGSMQIDDKELYLTPAGEKNTVTSPVPTVNGVAAAFFHSGTRAGTMKVKASIVDSKGGVVLPQLTSETTEFQILAGPPFLDTSDPNDPFTKSRMTLGAKLLNIYAGALNTDFSKTPVTALIGDRYNNPISKNTSVYFTTTGGIITSETGFTNSDGLASVTLYNGNPFPRWTEPFIIPNPNKSIGGPEAFRIPGFDFDGDGRMNDGVAIVTAYTEGMDQDGRQVKVWYYLPIVLSLQVTTFTVESDVTTLPRGQSTPITIVVHDINGNPIVGDSILELSTIKGSLSDKKITTNSPGVTVYRTTLVNDLTSSDSPGNTVVTVKILSANGEYSRQTAPIYLQ